jgi:neutral ceramidase
MKPFDWQWNMRRWLGHVSLSLVVVFVFAALALPVSAAAGADTSGFRAGAAAVEFQSDDSMEIAGSILAGKATGQEGKLRAVAVVLAGPGETKLAIVACDLLMLTRDLLDPALDEISRKTGIPVANILVNCTHTHHAPSSVRIHGYARNDEFCRQVQRKIVEAVVDANKRLSSSDCSFHFFVTEERTVGMNSRLMLGDGTIFWIGDRSDAVRPTGPFDPELPVLSFRNAEGKPLATLFNHSTHTIGTRQPGKRSPSYYGLAAQELESEIGGVVSFLEGASGSTHNLNLSATEAATRIKLAVGDALKKAEARAVSSLAAVKREFRFRVRTFDEAREDAAVTAYCEKRAGGRSAPFIQVFRNMRNELASQQGQERATWLQAMLIGDVALVGVPAEFFTKLGLDIKNRSPFRHTYVAELANDWVGYVPDLDAFKLGGYQVWTGFHSYVEPGTGERIVDEVVSMLQELKKGSK